MSQFILANKTPNSSTVIPPEVAPEVTDTINGASSGAETVHVEEVDEVTKAKGDKGS